MLNRVCACLLVLLASTCLPGAEPELAFTSPGEGLYDFNTGRLRGRLKLDGQSQGVYPLIDVESGMELVHPPGVFSFYRVLTTNGRYGNAARDWPTTSRLLPDGGVEVRWAAAEDHPLEIEAVYRWSAADALDLDIAVTPKKDMPRFELFMSSYFAKTFLASVYVKDGEQERFVPADKRPDSPGGYVMYPRDEDAVGMIRDGRWTIPPSPVDWAIERRLARPLVIRRDAGADVTAAMMARGNDCFAIASPWNPATPEAGGYRSVYLCLFGRDLASDETAHTTLRLVIAHGLSDERAVERHEEFVAE